jgi:hypothetical protein
LTTFGISGIRVDLELTDELDLNNLFIFASLGLPGLDFYCFGLSTARHLSTTLHLCSPTMSPRSYACVLSVCPPDLLGPSLGSQLRWRHVDGSVLPIHPRILTESGVPGRPSTVYLCLLVSATPYAPVLLYRW